MAMSGDEHGWQRLLNITDTEIRRANEDTIDELYAFLLTNRIHDTLKICQQPNDMKKILGTVQTILRLKDAEFQEMFTAYEENQKSPGQKEQENERLKQLIAQQETRIYQLENGLGGGTNIREVTVLRQEVDELRGQLSGTRNQLDREKIEKDKLTRELSSVCQKERELEVEMVLKTEEVEGYRNKLSVQSMSGVMGMIEEELRERLKIQEREMAEQLDRIEELITDKQGLDQKMSDLENKFQQSEEQKAVLNETVLKHQDVLNQADDDNRALQTQVQRLLSDNEHISDQLNNQMDTNKQLTVIIEKERDDHRKEVQSKSDELVQYQQKLVQVENQLRMLLQDTNKSHVVKLTKEVSDKHGVIEQLQRDLLESSETVSNLTLQLEEAKKLNDPNHVNEMLSQELKSLQLKFNESENLLKMEKDRRLQVEKEKERYDKELVEVRRRLEQYETGQIGLREAVLEIKQRKNELAQRDSEIAKLIQQVNKLQTQTDTMYDQNEAFRHRLGMGPNDVIGLEDIRNRKEKDMSLLKEDNNILSINIARLEEEKLILRKKLIEKTLPTSRPHSATPAHSPGTSKTVLSPDHMVMADLNGQISHLQSLLETERKRKEACQKEIARLSRGFDDQRKRHVSGGSKKMKSIGGSLLSIEDTDYDSNEMVVLKHENHLLQQKLIEVTRHNEQLMADSRRVMDKHREDVGSSVFDWKGSEKRPPYIELLGSNTVSQDHLLMVMRELREREQLLSTTREQLEQFRRKFTVIIHQQGVLYKEYNDTKNKWEKEKETYQQKMDEIELERDQNVIKIEELERLQTTLAASDPNTTNQRIGDMSRRLTKLRVNERTLLRRCSLLETSQTGLRKEVSVLKQSVHDIQLHCEQQLTYLQRYKDAACYKISSLHKQLSESVPLVELDETRKCLSNVTNQYQALLASLVAMETGDMGDKIRELNLAISEARMREEKLTEQIINESTDSKSHKELQNIINSLENTIAKLKQENSRIKQRAELSEQQLEFVHNKNTDKEREIEILQQNNIELATTNDHKTIIGQLQQQLLTLKQSEADKLNQLYRLQSKVQELQTQLLQSLQQFKEKEDIIDTVKAQSTARITRLNCLLLSYRRRFNGATLLPDQEKLYLLLSKAKHNKEKTNTELKQIEEESVRVQDRHAELLVQQRNLQELIAILKDGKEEGFVNKITEWHSKLGEMRLKEIQQQRAISRLEEKTRHLSEQVMTRDKDLSILEQKLVQADKNMEDISFCFDDTKKGIGDSILNESEERKPDNRRDQETKETILPMDQQPRFVPTAAHLQSDVLKYETQMRTLQTALTNTEDQLLNMRRSVMESEEKVTHKNNIIMGLEHRINILEERLVYEGKEKATSSQNTIKLATDTLEQIQAQLSHKEDQLERYQQLLQNSKREHFTVQENQRQEIDKLRRQNELLHQKLVEQHETDIHNKLVTHNHNIQSVEDQYLQIKELQNIIKNLEESNETLSEQLQQSMADWEGERRELKTIEGERKKENNELKIRYNLQIKEIQGTLTVKNGRIHDLEEELEITKAELSTAMESATKSPSKSLQGLVSKLRIQLTEKEKQLESLRKALQQVRNDLVETAQKTIESHSRQDTLQYNVQKMINDRTIEVRREFEGRIEELSDELIMKEQLLETKTKEASNYQTEHERQRVKLNTIEKNLRDRTVELEESENSLKQVQRQLEESQRNEERSKKELERQISSNNNDEQVELRERCLLLQSRVEELTMRQQTEMKKPGHIDNKHSSVEVARWEESKKWQKRLESAKMKLLERNKELETCQKQVTSLREITRRTEREKGLLQDKLRSEKEGKKINNSSGTAGTVDEIYSLKTQIYEQTNQIRELKKQLHEQKTDVIEQLSIENKLLKQSNIALQNEMKSFEHKAAVAGGGGSWLAHETHLRQQLLQTKKQYTQLQFEHEQLLVEVPRLRSRVDELQHYVQMLKSGTGHDKDIRVCIGSKPGTYTANEVEKVVSAMKKVIERLQSENDSLKRNSRKHSKKDIELENQQLKDELEKTRQTLASLGEANNGDTPLMTVIAENDRLRAELRKEVERTEKRASDISRMKIEKSRLQERLTEFSEPQEVLLSNRDELRRENMKLRNELESFDSKFFEEIEDLKYNYQEAVKKNIEYEEHIQLLTSQYGLTHDH